MPIKTPFHAVADPTRRRILDLLATRERSVTSLAGEFTISQPALSQHLRVLRVASLVDYKQSGRNRIYFLTPLPLQQMHRWLKAYARFWDDDPGALGRLLDRDT